MKLSEKLIDKIVSLLLKHVHDGNRRSLITPVFLPYDSLFKQIDWTGNDQEFVTKLVVQLYNYGKVESGKESLVLLLNRLRKNVGYDAKKEIDSLLTELERIELERRQSENSSNFFTKIISFFWRILARSDKQNESIPATTNTDSDSSQSEKSKQIETPVESEQGCSGIFDWIWNMMVWGFIILVVIAVIRENFFSEPTPAPPIVRPDPTTVPSLVRHEPMMNRIDGAVYVHIPAGEFIIGSDNERGYLDEYWIMQTEVTNNQYQKFMSAGGYTNSDYWSNEGWASRNGTNQPECWGDENFRGGEQPVVCISWFEAVAYTKWLSDNEYGLEFGLPSELEWEKAARGTDGHIYPWGNEWDNSRLNFCDSNCLKDGAEQNANDNYIYTAPVKSYPNGVSPYGIYDMAGNVWEWTTGQYEEGSRIMRGGSWAEVSKDVKTFVRHSFNQSQTYPQGGFRVRLSHSNSIYDAPIMTDAGDISSEPIGNDTVTPLPTVTDIPIPTTIPIATVTPTPQPVVNQLRVGNLARLDPTLYSERLDIYPKPGIDDPLKVKGRVPLNGLVTILGDPTYIRNVPWRAIKYIDNSGWVNAESLVPFPGRAEDYIDLHWVPGCDRERPEVEFLQGHARCEGVEILNMGELDRKLRELGLLDDDEIILSVTRDSKAHEAIDIRSASNTKVKEGEIMIGFGKPGGLFRISSNNSTPIRIGCWLTINRRWLCKQ